MSRLTSDVFRTSFLTMDGTFDPNNSQLFFRALQAPLNTTDNSFYSLGAAQTTDPSLRINKYDSNGTLQNFGYLYDTQFNLPPPGKFLIVAGGSAPNTLVYSQDRLTWDISPNGSTFLSTSCLAIAYDGFTWVAGGIGSRNVVYSSNGIDWLDISGASNILTVQCSAIATNGALWIAGGISLYGLDNYCSMCFSYDTITWYNISENIRNIFVQGTVACIAYNGSIWLAGGSYVIGTMIFPLALSTDGIYWTGISATSAILNECYSLCWNGSLWFAGGNYSGSARILYSINGRDWTIANLNGTIPTSVRAIAWNGTLLVAGGYDMSGLANTLAYSYDGITWLASMSPVFPSLCDGITWDGITWQAVGEGGIAISSDGLTWTLNTQGSTILPQGNDIVVNKILPFVAPTDALPDPASPLALVGGRDDIIGCTIAYSTDGISWKTSQQVANVFGDATTNVLSWNGTIWVAGFDSSGYPSIGYSYDGINWNSSTTGTTIMPDSVDSVAWGINKFIAFGHNGPTYKLMDSSDGVTWTDITPNPFYIRGPLSSLEYNGYIWLLTGQSGGFGYTVNYSTDGRTWTRSVSGSTIFSVLCNPISWNGRIWSAAGTDESGNTVAYSSDGINWTRGSLTYTSGTPYSIAWNGSLFVMASQSNLGYSYDGITWYPADYIPITPVPIMRSVTWTGTIWIATGYNVNNGTILYSYNGTFWYDSYNGSDVISQGTVIAANRVNPYNGNTLPPPVFYQETTATGGYGVLTTYNISSKNVNNLYRSSVLYMDETNGVVGINQKTQNYVDLSGTAIREALEISGGGITVNVNRANFEGTPIPGLYLIANNVAAGSGGRIEMYDAVNQFGWRIDSTVGTVHRLKIQSREGVSTNPLKLVMDMRNDNAFVGMGILADTVNRLKVDGDVVINGNLTVNGTKSFAIDHPNPALKDTHILRHCCVEGPSRGETLNRWMLTTRNGTCVQALPSYSPYLNENWQFLISAKNSFGSGYVTMSPDETFFTLHATEDGTYSVIGIATRKDKDSLSFDEQGIEPIKLV
jgi:hypothetical protein